MEVCSTDKIITEARTWGGTPYRHQHSAKGRGCDCLGFVRGVWRNVIGPEPMTAPNYSASWDEGAKTELLLNMTKRLFVSSDMKPTPGDVLVFRMKRGAVAKHCAILTETYELNDNGRIITNGKMIHAINRFHVHETDFNNWWKRKMVFSGSFPLETI